MMEARGHAGFSNSDKVRTHMMFSQGTAVLEQRRRSKRFKREKSTSQIQHDTQTQTGEVVDPNEWTGNQRVLHFGPMGTRDQYYYFYPKGWDILYPAHFGFFPYRTKEYRGSRPTICLAAFGAYFCLGGTVMTYLGYVVPNDTEYFMDPLKIAGPVVLGLGLLFLLTGCCWWFCALHLFSEQLRHTQPHHTAPRRIVQYRDFAYEQEMSPKIHRRNKPLPPPPIPAIVMNRNTSGLLYAPEAEMKLYPPTRAASLYPLSIRSLPTGGSLPGGIARTDTLRSHATMHGAPPSIAGSVFENSRETAMAGYHGTRPPHLIQDPFDAYEAFNNRQRVIGNPMAK